MITPFGEWTGQQCNAAMEAFIAHGHRMAGHPLARRDSPQILWDKLCAGEVRGAMIDGFVLIYDVGPTWCCREDILHEYMVARATPGGSFEHYLAGLRHIAHVNGCIGIMTGNGVLRPGLRKLYERAGFEKQNEAYFLGVQHGRFG